jgi:predicted outer membrane protein
MDFRKLFAIPLCGASLVMSNLFGADQVQAPPAQQQPTQAQQQGRPGQAGQRAQWQNADHTLASCVATANQEEVALAKFAQDKAQNDDVKHFAKMMIEDHQAFLEKLEKFAPEASRKGYLDEKNSSTRDDSNQTTSTKTGVQPAGGANNANQAGAIQQTKGTQAAARGNQPLDIVALDREVAQECLKSTKEKLQEKKGSEFDECFITQQVIKHAAMKDKLAVFQRHASAELAQVLSDGAETTEKHLKEAEDILKNLSNDSASKSSRQERREERRTEKK